MVNKFKLATKRIAAIAASAAIVSSGAFAGVLNNYPQNFAQNGKFVGKVVVGSAAAAIDTTSATSIIEDLAATFSGSKDKVKITATKSKSGAGTSINAVKSNLALNYGDKLGTVSEQSGFDDGNTKILNDETFDNGVSNEDYEQKLFVGKDSTTSTDYGEFNYALRDNVDGVDKITDGIYFANGDVYAQYVFDLKKNILVDTSTTDKKNDFVGKTLEIMGVEYTISDIHEATAPDGIDKLELIGGANKISLGEGDSTEVNVGGTSYEVSVQSVSADKVLLTVNGESKSIDELDTENVGGVNVAVTDLVSSNRDAVKGYAEIVVGGQKILLQEGNVKIDDEDVNDIYDDYNVDVDFTSSVLDEMDKFVITYKVDDDVLLQNGDKLVDPLFGAFNVVYEGTNDVEYQDITLRTDDDDLKIAGKLESGNNFDQALLHAVKNSDDTAGAVYMVGDNDNDRVVFKSSKTSLNGNSATAGDLVLAGVSGTVTIVAGGADGSGEVVTSSTANSITVKVETDGAGAADSTWAEVVTAINGDATFTGSVSTSNGAQTVITTDAQTITLVDSGINYDATNGWVIDPSSTAIKGDGFLVRDTNNEDQYLYQVKSISRKTGNNNDEVSFDELLGDSDQDDVVFSASAFAGAFDVTLNHIAQGTADEIYLSNSAATSQLSDIIAFDGEILLTLGTSTELADVGEDNAGTKGTFKFDFDDSDLDFEDASAVADVNIGYDWDTDDTEFNLYLTSGDYVNANDADNEKSNSDDQTFVNAYGVKVKYDNKDRKEVVLSMPDEEVYGKVSLVFGDAGSVETKTFTLDESVSAAKISELEADGYTVTSEKVASEVVEFDVTAPTYDVDVTSVEDAIVVGGPAVNSAARSLLGITNYDISQAGVANGEAVAKYFEDSNSVLVYGYTGEDTAAIVKKLNDGTADFE